MFLLTKVNDLLKSVSAFGADKVFPHSRSCGASSSAVWKAARGPGTREVERGEREKVCVCVHG